jgi:hypothetical protein
LPFGDRRDARQVLTDWGSDLEAKLVSDPEISGNTHEAFHRAVRQLLPDILSILHA